MSQAVDRVRADVWLWRARFVKTRSLAAKLIGEGGVRVTRGDLTRRLEKPAAELAEGDVLLLMRRGELAAIRVRALGVRRGPPAEARALYEEIAAGPNPDLAGLA